MSAAPVAILAGGTGGHIFPGLAVARTLRDRGVPVIWLGARGRMETRLVPAQGFALETIDISAVRGQGVLNTLFAPLRVARAVWQARAVLRRHRPRAVISFGGFAAGPAGLAARLAGLPLLVHEQNRVPGLTNRVLARLARRVLQGFPDSFAAALRPATVGNPVRPEIASLPPPVVRFAAHDAPARLLVLGGSQGARALNEGVPRVLATFDPASRPQVRHQCGEQMVERATQAYAQAGIDARLEPFIADMAEAYAWADLVVCRAGALTLAELCAAGVGSVLVPFPRAADDHQTRNAEFLVSHGAAVVVAEGDGFETRLAEALRLRLSDPALRLRMAEAARLQARPDAADRVVDAVLAEAAA